jgi:hypothetical protein
MATMARARKRNTVETFVKHAPRERRILQLGGCMLLRFLITLPKKKKDPKQDSISCY